MFEELSEEISDFIEDIEEFIIPRYHKKQKRPKRPISIDGMILNVRPAFVFAQRIEGILKIVFGGSIMITAIITSFHGINGTSDLIRLLIGTIGGRFLMFVMGFSYLMLGIWKFSNIKGKNETGK